MVKALLLVDLQKDFMPGGNLAVAEGDLMVAKANELIAKGGYDFIVASQDWHPTGHGSFASTHSAPVFTMGTLNGEPQMMWPNHCEQNTPGAELHPDLNIPAISYIQEKGTDKNIDSYSAFADNGKNAKTGLDEKLKSFGVTELHVCGLATDYCVSASAIDATRFLPGVKVAFIEDASRGVAKASTDEAIERMKTAGVEISTIAQVLAQAKPGAEISGDLVVGTATKAKEVA